MERFVFAKPGIILDHEDDGVILFDPASAKLLHLNETGAFLYGLLDGQRSLNRLVDVLMSEYAATDRAGVTLEVQEFLRVVVSAGLADER